MGRNPDENRFIKLNFGRMTALRYAAWTAGRMIGERRRAPNSGEPKPVFTSSRGRIFPSPRSRASA